MTRIKLLNVAGFGGAEGVLHNVSSWASNRVEVRLDSGEVFDVPKEEVEIVYPYRQDALDFIDNIKRSVKEIRKRKGVKKVELDGDVVSIYLRKNKKIKIGKSILSNTKEAKQQPGHGCNYVALFRDVGSGEEVSKGYWSDGTMCFTDCEEKTALYKEAEAGNYDNVFDFIIGLFPHWFKKIDPNDETFIPNIADVYFGYGE